MVNATNNTSYYGNTTGPISEGYTCMRLPKRAVLTGRRRLCGGGFAIRCSSCGRAPAVLGKELRCGFRLWRWRGRGWGCSLTRLCCGGESLPRKIELGLSAWLAQEGYSRSHCEHACAENLAQDGLHCVPSAVAFMLGSRILGCLSTLGAGGALSYLPWQQPLFL